MSPSLLALGIFVWMLVLLALRMPIAVAMAVAGGTGYALQAGALPLAHFLNHAAFARFASYDLSVIPLFILMGHFATQGGISKALFDVAARAMAGFRGGLAMAAVLASAAFGAICGSSVATAATITSVALPQLRRHGYSGALSTATLAAGGTLGILIPPSVPLVLYAILAEQNIAQLFAAALVPGLLAMVGYVLVIAVLARLRPHHVPPVRSHPPTQPATAAPAGTVGRGVVPIALVFTVVFGGIYGGLFTPTEGAAIGATATFLAAVLQGELRLPKIAQCVYATAQSSAMIFLIFLGADLMNAALALTQLSQQLADMVRSLALPPLVVVTGILVFYVVLGSVMDELSMLMLTIPIFFPVILGLDLGLPAQEVGIWFGILVLMTVGFGMLAPPVGLNVYVVNAMAKDVPIAQSYRGVVPFLLSDVLRTALLLLFPTMSLGVARLVG